EAGKPLPGLKVAWLGDGNNVLASIMEAAGLMQFDVVAACPQGFMPASISVSRSAMIWHGCELSVRPLITGMVAYRAISSSFS
ncbi:MAG: hypothetical protein EOP67_45090, partial [Sphingomonas sp.]